MPEKKSFLKLLLSLILILLIYNSCEEKFTNVGDALLPDGDGMFVKTDTIEDLKFKTILSEPIITSDYQYPLVGEIKDNFFGKKSTALITQFVPHHLIFDDSVQIEDAYIILAISSVLGKDHSYVNLTVSELATNTQNNKHGLDQETSYYSNNRKEEFYASEKILASVNLTPAYDFEWDANNNFYFLKIKLPDYYAQRLYEFQDSIMDVDSFYVDTTINDVFIKDYFLINKVDINVIDSLYNEKFGALAIKINRLVEEETGCMLGFNIYNITNARNYVSRLEVNYTYIENDSVLDGSFHFTMNPAMPSSQSGNTIKYRSCTNFSEYKHEYQGFPINDYINSDLESDTLSFIQSMTGVKTYLTIPSLDSIFNNSGRVLINKAILKFETDSTHYVSVKHNSPSRIWASLSNSTYEGLGNYFNLNTYDTYAKYQYQHNGLYIDSLHNYNLQIPHLIQKIIEGKANNELFIYPGIGETEINYDNNRLNYGVLNTRSAKLILTYSLP